MCVMELEEGWVKFIRIDCKEGWIDRWIGDCINNPNNPVKARINLNSSVTYYRCNVGQWVIDRDLGRSQILELLSMREEFTSIEIWDELLRLRSLNL